MGGYRSGEIVVTGPLCSGKTSLVEYLQDKGFPIVTEAGRSIITQEQHRDEISPGAGRLPWTKPYEFRAITILRQLELEFQAKMNRQNPKLPRFLDAGLLENIVYCQQRFGNVPREFEFCRQKGRYDKVFWLEPLFEYTNDAQRWETSDQAKELGIGFKRIYLDEGYDVIDVPVIPVPDRAQFVLEKLK
jgi:predicted ATPase